MSSAIDVNDPVDNRPEKATRRRRVGICGQTLNPEALRSFTPPEFPKDAHEKRFLIGLISGFDVLFKHLSKDAQWKVMNAMFERHVRSGEALITQGEAGDNFYIVDSGNFDISVARKGQAPEVVLRVTRGGSFGELALLYNAPRAATVTAVTDGKVWALDRDTFRLMIVTQKNTKKKRYESSWVEYGIFLRYAMYQLVMILHGVLRLYYFHIRWEGFLSQVQIFSHLNDFERGQISDILRTQVYNPGQCIVRQGDKGDRFFLLEDGTAHATISHGKKELFSKGYSKGGYFGELALIGGGNRKASVFANTKCNLLWIDKETFNRVFGGMLDKLKEIEYPTCDTPSKYPIMEEG